MMCMNKLNDLNKMEKVLNSNGRNNPRHPLYSVWVGMKNRCYNKKDKYDYHWYGGRGIEVCDRWLDKHTGFLNFVKDMGPRPKGFSLDRIDVNGNYCPENCRWADPKQQAMNRRNNVKVEIHGKILTPSAISELSGVSEDTIRTRIKHGKSGDDLLSPLGVGSPKRVRCIETGEEFSSIAMAAREKGLRSNSLWSVLRGPAKTAGGLHWEYAKNADEVYNEIKKLV